MTRKLYVLLVLFLGVFSNAQNRYFEIYTDSTTLKTHNDALIADFEEKIKSVDPKLSLNGLKTIVPKTFMPGQYKSKNNCIYHVTWSTAQPLMGPALAKITGSDLEGSQLAGLFFYGFFLPHEIGHAFHQNCGKVPENNYDSEYESNVIAFLYWRKMGKEQELQQCYTMAKKALANLKDPIPENVDRKKYFTENYSAFLSQPEKYGYIQFSQIVEIFEDKTLPDFDTYIKKLSTRK